MEHRIAPGLVACMAILVTTPAAPAQDCDVRCAPARTHTTYNLLANLGGELGADTDFIFSIGRLAAWGGRGGWMARGEGGIGVGFYGYNDASLLGGLHLGIGRVLTGDYLALTENLPTELYATLGGGGYVGWNMKETPGATRFIPAIGAGFGIRVRTDTANSGLVMLELFGEERLGIWDRKLFFRVGVTRPRGARPEPAPTPAPPTGSARTVSRPWPVRP